MNPNRPSFDPRPPPGVGIRPPGAQGQQQPPPSSGQARPPSAMGNRGFRGRPTHPRHVSFSQDASLSRSTTRTSDGDVNQANEAALERLVNFHREEQTIRNDLALRYATSGEWGGNHINGVDPEETCKEYPKLHRLMELKQEQVSKLAHPALHMTFDPISDPLMSLTTHLPIPFDVILIDPPPSYDWAQITSIPIRLISADPSFVFLWVGDAAGDGLERGREALLRWGFRRCEEILWVKPNRKAMKPAGDPTEGNRPGESDVERWMRQGRRDDGDQPTNIMVTQKEHCLMGIRGTVRRKTDNWFVHCNVDTDVMVWERDENDETAPRFPPQLYSIIEHFCLGTRRLELFGPKSRARKGWVTLGEDDMSGRSVNKGNADQVHKYTPSLYHDILQNAVDLSGRNVLPQVDEIEAIRPKSPTRGDRSGSMPSKAIPPRSRPGGAANRGDFAYQNHQQGSFRPPRMQVPPLPPWTSSAPNAPPTLYTNNPHWMTAPPRMQVRYDTSALAFPQLEMNHMRAELGAIDSEMNHVRPSSNPPIPHLYGPPEGYTSNGYQSYPSQLPPPQFHQYPNMNQNFTMARPRAADQPFPNYPVADLQVSQPPWAQEHGYRAHPDGTFAGNGQYDYQNSLEHFGGFPPRPPGAHDWRN